MSTFNYTCCTACGWGKSDTPDTEIQEQTAKHGEYICKGCEDVFERIINAPKGDPFTIDKGYGPPCETLISEHGIYYFDGPRVENPNQSFLGFGGAWFLIVKSYQEEYGRVRKAMVCNNLWHSRSIPKSYLQRLKEADKIDSIIIAIQSNQLAELRELLNEINYF